MRRVIVAAVTVASLAIAGAAGAGCFATVGLNPLPPASLDAATVWTVDIAVRQHGERLLPGATPTVIIREAKGGATERFRAAPTGRTGIYRADVVFPRAGAWNLAVNDGFPEPECATTHTFGTVAIGAAGGPPADSGSFPLWPLVGGLAGAAAVVALALSARRLRAPTTASR